MNVSTWLLAQAQQGQQGPGIIGIVTLVAPLMLIFYFLVLRPEQQKAEKKEKLIQSIKKGDKVILASGIHGTVHEIQETSMMVEIADKVRIKVERSAVQALATPPAAAA